ncbi:MAG: MTH1187 family thiamine-binding protein [Gemmatimonadaceae bacterium]
MLLELSIIPVGGDVHLSEEIADVLSVIDESGLPYQLTASGTLIEGGWDEVMNLVKRCHERARTRSPHVFTTIRIEDDEGARDKLIRNVRSVEEKLGRKLGRTAASS